MTAKALTSTATQSDESYSSELATIEGEPGLLYQHHEGNASMASSEHEVIASAGTKLWPLCALSTAQQSVSLASASGNLSRPRLSTCLPQTSLCLSTT